MKPRAMVLAAPGVNCDRETVEACRAAGATAELVHLNQLLDGNRRLRDYGLLVLPGGFSYGDHLGAGAMLAATLRYHLHDDILRFVADGRPVLGICNGFQVLARLGLLGQVALVPNASGRFICRWTRLRVMSSPCSFLDGLEDVELPIAHGQGRVIAPASDLAQLIELTPLRYEDNPNGSVADAAAVCNRQGNVLGVMPHPERYVSPFQHPRRRHTFPAGLLLFKNVVRQAAMIAS